MQNGLNLKTNRKSMGIDIFCTRAASYLDNYYRYINEDYNSMEDFIKTASTSSSYVNEDGMIRMPMYPSVREEVYASLTRYLEGHERMYGLVPSSICSGRNSPLLESWIKWNPSIAIINLSRFSFTGLCLCLIYIEKDGQGNVFLADVREVELPFELAPGLLKSDDKRYVWKGNISDIQKSALIPINYIGGFSIKEGEVAIQLNDLIEIQYMRDLNSKDKDVLFVDENMLSADDPNCVVRPLPFLKGNARSSKWKGCIDEDCMLIAFDGNHIKIGRTQGVTLRRRLMVKQNIIAFKLKTDRISEKVLLRSLLSESMERQIIYKINRSNGDFNRKVLLDLSIILSDT